MPGPMRDHLDNQRSQRAHKRREERLRAIAGEKITSLLDHRRDAEEAAGKIASIAPDGIRGLSLYFKLFGGDLITWNRVDSTFYVMGSHLLDDLSIDDVREVYEKNSRDMDTIYGIGRWLFYFGHQKDLDDDEMQFVVEKIAPVTLGHPQRLNRMITMSFLRQNGSENAKQMLRDVLAGTVETRHASPEAISEPHGGVNSERIDPWVKRTVSDKTYAALLLAHLKDVQSLAAIKGMLLNATKDDLEILDQAISMLERQCKSTK